jgi:hypothetical protein
MLKHFIKNMKIFQVKYNQNHYCYYKAEFRESVDEKTIMYKTYNECRDGINQLDTFESVKIVKSLLKFYKNKI